VTARRPRMTEGVMLEIVGGGILSLSRPLAGTPTCDQTRGPELAVEAPAGDRGEAFLGCAPKGARTLPDSLPRNRMAAEREYVGSGRSVGPTSEQDDTNAPDLPAAADHTSPRAAAGEERAAALHCMWPSTRKGATPQPQPRSAYIQEVSIEHTRNRTDASLQSPTRC
jgi:hypothetical protein